MGYQSLNELIDDGKEEEIRNWASYRGQTLGRTGAWNFLVIYINWLASES